MSSWIKCTCGELLHKNLFCGARVSVVTEDTVLDSIEDTATAKVAIDKIVHAGDTLVRCKACGRIAIEDRATGVITLYSPEANPS
jgi:hypothetical protein